MECTEIVRDEVTLIPPRVLVHFFICHAHASGTRIYHFSPFDSMNATLSASRHVRSMRARLGSGSLSGTPHEATVLVATWNGFGLSLVEIYPCMECDKW